MFEKRSYLVKNIIIAAGLTLAVSSSPFAQQTGERLAYGSWSTNIADSFIRLHPDSIIYKTEAKSRKWNYEQGLMYNAFHELWRQTNDKTYYDYIIKNVNYYVQEDGSIKTYKQEEYNIDNISSGRELINLYAATGEAKYKSAASLLRTQLKTHPRTSEGGFWHKKIYPNQMWLDGLYMAEPFYVQYAQTFNEAKALDDIARQFELIDKYLKDEKTGLYFHGWDESKQMKWADPVKGTSPNFWGRALGWYMMALVDVLDYMPKDHPSHSKLVKSFQDLSASLLNFRDAENKLWHQIIDKGGKEGNYLEASASMMFIYAYAKGYNKGYLDKIYYDAAMESFKSGLKRFVTIDENDNIYLNHTVSVGGLGGNPYRDGSYEYYLSEPRRINDFKGYGPFLLAAIELEKDAGAIGRGKRVALDYYFNNERKNGKRYHYTWEDEAFSGFSDIGRIFRKLGAETVPVISAPTKENLNNISIYIIVDPDTKKENPAPNFIDDSSINVITDWVNNGGTLILLANDTGNCELDKFNKLANKFGITFTQTSENRVTGSNFGMGKFDSFPAHPVFDGVNKIYLKEISILDITAPAVSVLEHKGKVIMAGASYGEGYVFAVGDPWLYNEYLDNRKLPEGFENYKAAENLFKWLLDGRISTANQQ